MDISLFALKPIQGILKSYVLQKVRVRDEFVAHCTPDPIFGGVFLKEILISLAPAPVFLRDLIIPVFLPALSTEPVGSHGRGQRTGDVPGVTTLSSLHFMLPVLDPNWALTSPWSPKSSGGKPQVWD